MSGGGVRGERGAMSNHIKKISHSRREKTRIKKRDKYFLSLSLSLFLVQNGPLSFLSTTISSSQPFFVSPLFEVGRVSRLVRHIECMSLACSLLTSVLTKPVEGHGVFIYVFESNKKKSHLCRK